MLNIGSGYYLWMDDLKMYKEICNNEDSIHLEVYGHDAYFIANE